MCQALCLAGNAGWIFLVCQGGVLFIIVQLSRFGIDDWSIRNLYRGYHHQELRKVYSAVPVLVCLVEHIQYP